MGVKKLSSVFMRCALCLALSAFTVSAVNLCAYLYCVSAGAIYPLNSIYASIDSSKERLQTAGEIAEDDIPPVCEYVLFTEDGQYKGGSLGREDAASVWQDCVGKAWTSGKPYLYSVIDREREVLVLRYRTTAQFGNKTLRRIFPSVDLLLIVTILLEILLSTIIISFKFGKYLKKKLDRLLAVVQKIERQDLNFEVEKSGLLELDGVLDALDHMRLALRQSLTEQWQDEKTRQDQLSALAHDLKTPLTIIRGNTELLLESSLSLEQRECADYIETSSTQMQDYVQTLIEATRSWDSCQLRTRQIGVEDFLRGIKEQIGGLCAVGEVTLRLERGENLRFIFADHDLFMRALINILSNAVEHTPPGGTVTIKTGEENGWFSFTVTDSGTGFSSEALRHGTEQFFMDDDSRSSGTHYGIGLYMADSVIRKHRGEMLLGNAGTEGGAVVTVRIPHEN